MEVATSGRTTRASRGAIPDDGEKPGAGGLAFGNGIVIGPVMGVVTNATGLGTPLRNVPDILVGRIVAGTAGMTTGANVGLNE